MHAISIAIYVSALVALDSALPLLLVGRVPAEVDGLVQYALMTLLAGLATVGLTTVSIRLARGQATAMADLRPPAPVYWRGYLIATRALAWAVSWSLLAALIWALFKMAGLQAVGLALGGLVVAALSCRFYASLVLASYAALDGAASVKEAIAAGRLAAVGIALPVGALGAASFLFSLGGEAWVGEDAPRALHATFEAITYFLAIWLNHVMAYVWVARSAYAPPAA